MTLDRINPPQLAEPSGFAHAVRTTARATVHLAGQTAMDATGHIVEGDIVVQFEQALGNLLTALRAAGGAPDDLVSLTVYIVDMDGYQARARDIGAVWRRLVGGEYPAMAGIGVSRLWDREALVEVQGVAALSGRDD
jgi:enamine deaminase RidA (YjgF/YER057c/UK114 family)